MSSSRTGLMKILAQKKLPPCGKGCGISGNVRSNPMADNITDTRLPALSQARRLHVYPFGIIRTTTSRRKARRKTAKEGRSRQDWMWAYENEVSSTVSIRLIVNNTLRIEGWLTGHPYI